jgi:hypothetical protein
MKPLIKEAILLTIIIISNEAIIAQTSSDNINSQQFSLYNATEKYMYSELIADSFFVFVSVPDGYYSSDKR